jgi:hypothetical protein
LKKLIKNQIIEALTRRSSSIEIVRDDVTKLKDISTNLNKIDINDQTKENLTNE